MGKTDILFVVKNWILEMTFLNTVKGAARFSKKKTSALESDRLGLNPHLVTYYLTIGRLLTLKFVSYL